MPASKKPKIEKLCKYCSNGFMSNNMKQVFCSKNCTVYYARKMNPEKARESGRIHMRNRSPEKRRNQKLRETYGITLLDYQKMAEDQKSACGICNSYGKLFVDHNHSTGTVRELLCHGCNSGIGFFREDPILMEKAIKYIQKWQGK
ncbi:MAG: hypothetical protein HC840_01075 [Leptolyngbyaceae cyanobacterium RM2_2_4]|nr:hypothetical protein [Leptolyngbyaceae cyanobacterium RM2_2_4]